MSKHEYFFKCREQNICASWLFSVLWKVMEIILDPVPKRTDRISTGREKQVSYSRLTT